MDRLQEILDSKEFKRIKPISDYQIDKVQRLSSRYILFKNKDANHGFCECCAKDVTFESKTKHKSTVVCPSCKKEMTVEHIWRKHGCDYNLDWFLLAKAISKDVLVIRYIEGYQFRSYRKHVNEVAREIFDFTTGKRHRVDRINADNTWKKSSYYFIEHVCCSWMTRKSFCMTAKWLQSKKQVANELSKIDAVKYYDYERKLGTYYCLSDDILGLMSAPLYEKMEKVGLEKLSDLDFGRELIKWNRKETSLVKMLKLDKRRYNAFRQFPTVDVLSFLQKYSKVSDKHLSFLMSKGFDRYTIGRYIELRSKLKLNPIKAFNYIEKLNNKGDGYHYSRYSEYISYLDTLRKLNYDMTDESYLYPKDFDKADDRVASEYQAKKDEERLKGMSKQSELIKKISDGLRKMPDIQEFFKGSDGLLVYVPESAKELIEEGRLLHNCIGTYVDRIAEGKTLVFFVRRIEAPDEAFVAFEYVNGEVVQCRYDHNEDVKDDKIINFVEKFAERLRKNNVLTFKKAA